MRGLLVVVAAITVAMAAPQANAQAPTSRPHNVILFVADGLRFRMVDDSTAPTMAAMAREGVSLRNSHALFPTFTMANASAMATGHMLGDTGNFSNTIYTGFEVHRGGGATPTPFVESDPVLGELDGHWGNYLNEATILRLANDKGYSTAAIGKLGPTLLFDHTQRTGASTIIIDDSTGDPQQGIPLSAEMIDGLKAAVLPLQPPQRANGSTVNGSQQDYFAAVTTRVVLPLFKKQNKPFVLVFWSRDPDGTQHYQTDSLNSLVPGINGPTSLAAIRNADDDLARIRAALVELDLLGSTDIIAVADHGFSTISKESGTSAAAKSRFADTQAGRLPYGFLALDLAQALNLPLLDPDRNYKVIAPGEHPAHGNGFIGGDKNNPQVVVAANGGSDLIYLRNGDINTAKRTVDALLTQDYVSGIFVDRSFGKLPGTLSLSDIGLEGTAVAPRPAIVISFRSFDTICGDPVRCAVEVADTGLREGQGMHGSFSRADTWNFMAMQGPDFRSHFIDPAPASNADVGRTIAHLLDLPLNGNGKLVGRVLSEALVDGAVPEVIGCIVMSEAAPNGLATVLNIQMVGTTRYFDAAGFPGRTIGLSEPLSCPTR
jgi:hypothetical protein